MSKARVIIEDLLNCLTWIDTQCENLHHEKRHEHAMAQPCPVQAMINQCILKAEDYLDEQGKR